MHEVEAIERVRLVFDPAEHVHTATGAGMALDRRIGIDDLQLLLVRGDLELVAGNHGNLGEQGAFRLPALAATAGVVVRGLGADRHFDLFRSTLATQHAPFKARQRRQYSGVYRRVNLYGVVHGLFPPPLQGCGSQRAWAQDVPSIGNTCGVPTLRRGALRGVIRTRQVNTEAPTRLAKNKPPDAGGQSG